jgi:hypothetical protein
MFKQLLFKDLACIAFLLDEEEVHEMLCKRKIEGEFATLYRELIDDEMKYYKYICP